MSPAESLKLIRRACKTDGVQFRLSLQKPDTQATVYFGHEGAEAWLGWLESSVKGQGAVFLERLVSEADAHNVVLRADCDDDGSGKLFTLYERFGFYRDPAGSSRIERVPAPSRERAAESGFQSGLAVKRQRAPDSFREWHAQSKVRRVVYHATSSDFETFDTGKGDLGSHFGTLGQANRVAMNRLGSEEGTRIIPVWLAMKNPIRFKDVGSFHADGIALQMEKKGLLEKGEGKRIHLACDLNWRLRKTYDPMLREILRQAGYDGVVYSNTHEGQGDSYIAFDPEQIRSSISTSTAAPVAVGERVLATPAFVKSDSSPDVSEFQARMKAAQELSDLVRTTGQRLTIRSDGRVALFHSTSESSSAEILRDGKFNGNTWFAPSKTATLAHARPKHGKSLATIQIALDARHIEFSTGTGEFYAPDGLTRNEQGFWVDPSATEKRTDPLRKPEFRSWFGNSKVVDADGKPQVMFHGTSVGERNGLVIGDIQQFDRLFTQKIFGRPPSIDQVGSWFSNNPSEDGGAGMYVPQDSGAMYPVYLSIQNPWEVSFAGLKRQMNKHAGVPMDDWNDVRPTEKGLNGLRDWMKDLGIDGIHLLHDPMALNGSTEFEKQDVFIALEPTQIKSAIGNTGEFNPAVADIRFSMPAPDETEADNAPKDGWYSELSRQVAGNKQKHMPPGMWSSWIDSLKTKGVKPDEIEWSGIQDWLKLQTGKVTKEQVIEYLDANGVKVTEMVVGDRVLPKGWTVKKLGDTRGFEFAVLDESGAEMGVGDTEQDAIESAQDGDVSDAKYAKYQLPGGANYREVLLTLPSKRVWIDGSPVTAEDLSTEHGREAADRVASYVDDVFESSHWLGISNILAHFRVNDRVGVNGEKVLFVEEIQSDWGQKGKRLGFVSTKRKAELGAQWQQKIDAVVAEARVAMPNEDWDDYTNGESIAAMRQNGQQDMAMRMLVAVSGLHKSTGLNGSVPAGPFVGSTDKWVSLALKRIVKMAVDGGYDKVSFITGDQSAGRYELTKQVKSIEWKPSDDGADGRARVNVTTIEQNSSFVLFVDVDGNVGDRKDDMSGKNIADIVGKEVADKIASESHGSLSGDGLKIGGEGLRAFYDAVLPSIVKGVLKKLGGGALEQVVISDASFESKTSEADNQLLADLGIEVEGQRPSWQPGFSITDAMREKNRQLGAMPLFSFSEALQVAPQQSFVYPMAPEGEWYGDGNYKQHGGRLELVSPVAYLAAVRPLIIDEVSRENIDILKQHMQDGGKLDPLLILANGKEDGRHRAHAAMELDIEQVPVIAYGDYFKSEEKLPLVETAAFKAWSTGLRVFEHGQYGGGPAVFEVYHGTTFPDISVFKQQGNKEGFLGAGPYFTTSSRDASENYAGVGPDLRARLDKEAEDILDSPDEFSMREMLSDLYEAKPELAPVEGWDEDETSGAWDEHGQLAAEHAAMARLNGGSDGLVMKVFVRMEHPANTTVYGEDLTYQVEVDGDREVETGTLVDWIMSTNAVAQGYGINPSDYVSALLEEVDGLGTIGMDKVFTLAKKHLSGAYDDNGELVNGGGVFREIAEATGYDGVIMDADMYFGSGRRGFGGTRIPVMPGIEDGTLHIVPFSEKQVKSATGNSGAFDPKNNDIRFSMPEPAVPELADLSVSEHLVRFATMYGYKDGEEISDAQYDERAQYIAEAAAAVGLRNQVQVVMQAWAPNGQTTGVEITDLFAENPGSGGGSRSMTFITELANAMSMTLYLKPSSDRNREFYKRFGLVGTERPFFGFMVKYPDLSDEDLGEAPQASRSSASEVAPSRVVNTDGVPISVFHGTSQDFDAFEANERGIFFAEDRSAAENFVRVRKGPAARVIEAQLDIRNPWTSIEYGPDVPFSTMVDQSPAALKARGFDGIHMPKERVWIAFEPSQVRMMASHRAAPSYQERQSQVRQDVPFMASLPGESNEPQGDGDPSRPFDFSKDSRFHHLFYRTPSAQEVKAFSGWLRSNPNAFVRLYHGTAAVNPVIEKGLLPTTGERRNSLQSSVGYVCLSAYEGLAHDFGSFAASNRAADKDGARVAVYPVTTTVRRLLADLDQLANRRVFAGESVGNTLAESLIKGRGARVRGRIEPQCLGHAKRFFKNHVELEESDDESVVERPRQRA